MAVGTLNSRSIALHTFGNTTTDTAVIIPASAVPPGQRPAIYALILTASAADNLQVQDTNGMPLSQNFSVAGTGGGTVILDMHVNGDPWFQATTPGVGLQVVQLAPGAGKGTNIGWDAYWAASL